MRKNLIPLYCCLMVAAAVACKPKEIIVTSVVVNPDKVTLTEGETATLLATVVPEDATDPSITWSSSNQAVATVNPDGLVTAVKAGTAAVTAKANNGLMANCAVTVENIYKAVDMGLSVKWCSCNLGATSPEAPGDYYAWGETFTKAKYDWQSYTLCEGGSDTSLKKYSTRSDYGIKDDKTVLEAVDDAATQILGGDWRMPTTEEMAELMQESNCTWTKDTVKDVFGYRVTSKKTGNSIFLPAAGVIGGTGGGLVYLGKRGFYWTSSLYDENPSSAYEMSFGSNWLEQEICDRVVGLSIRPVCK